MPTHVGGTNGQQDVVRLKNLVRTAERKLVDFGMRAPEARDLVQPLRALPKEPSLWSQRNRGLALFLAPHMFRHLSLPVPLPEQVTVHRRFLIKPLIPLSGVPTRFWILALSQSKVRLLEAQQYGVREVEVPNRPADSRSALNYERIQRVSQAPSTAASGQGNPAAGFHGHSGERDTSKEDVERYFRLVDAALQPVLRDQRAPLVVAGVDYLPPIFRNVTSYPYVIRDEIHSNASQWSSEELLQRAWPLVEPEFERRRLQELARYRDLAGTGKATDDIRQILPAAQHGKVQTLLVNPAATCWGTFTTESGEVETHESEQPGDDDLLDLAAVHTLARRGAVLAASRDELPGASMAAAVFRF
jgi:hypothetical protein